ncbi:MAG: GTPase ObgE, partial [Acidisphaera sp.]|nr:GTPase ObgE [Acidisphaera sp.]MBV9813295.1 GTPase ObgE [Acetobacteraceae bacterium]
EVLVINKADAMSPRELAARRSALARTSGSAVLVMSGVTRGGVPEVLDALWRSIEVARRERVASAA